MKYKGWLFWTPRVLSLGFAAFISIFALDVFVGDRGLWETLLALAMHLIPTALILVILALAWRWPWVGAVFYPNLGVLYIVKFWGRFPPATYAIIAGPLFLLGVLFLLDWVRRYKEEPPPAGPIAHGAAH